MGNSAPFTGENGFRLGKTVTSQVACRKCDNKVAQEPGGG